MRRIVPVVIVVLAALTHAYANKSSPLPTLEKLTGAWVATGSWGHQYRLVINSDGTGYLGEIGLHDEPFLVDVATVKIDRYRIEIAAASREKDGERYLMKGDGTPRWFTLQCKALLGKSDVTFYRESEWQQAATKLADAISKAAE
jgi:hypothetical protein